MSSYRSIKVQVSISHTPEGTNTVRIRLIEAARTSHIMKVHEPSGIRIGLCTTPVGTEGVTR